MFFSAESLDLYHPPLLNCHIAVLLNCESNLETVFSLTSRARDISAPVLPCELGPTILCIVLLDVDGIFGDSDMAIGFWFE